MIPQGSSKHLVVLPYPDILTSLPWKLSVQADLQKEDLAISTVRFA